MGRNRRTPIKRTCRGWKDTETLKTLYCTLVRSQLEYGSVVWSPYTSRNIDKLERIQRRGTKFILGQNDVSYEDRLKCLNMLSLKRDVISLMLYSCIKLSMATLI